MEKDSKNGNEIIPIQELKGKDQVNFSEKIPSVPQKDADKIITSLRKNAVINSQTGETGVAIKALPTILNTDSENARNYALIQPKENFFEDNKGNQYIKTPTLIAETSKRAEEPREPVQRDILKQSRNYLTDVSDSHVAEKTRDHHRKKLQTQMKKEKEKVKREAIKNGKLNPSSAIDVHHKESVSSAPRKMADPTNLDPVDRALHQKWHQKGGGTAAEWEQYKKDQGH